MSRKIIWVAGLAILLVGSRATSAQVADQHHHPPQDVDAYIKVLEDPSRDEWQRPEQVIYTLDLKAGDEVADLGAGSGYFSIRLAKEVGPAGKVYAVDLEQKMLDYIEQRAQKEQLDNIQTILADPDDPKLGSASVDVIFTCNTLHHIDKRPEYYARLLRALRPSGRLVNIDFHKRKLPVGPPVEMKIEKKDSIKEIEAAGFRLLREFDILKYQYFLVFERED
jgi:arsenite methyltransferase